MKWTYRIPKIYIIVHVFLGVVLGIIYNGFPHWKTVIQDAIDNISIVGAAILFLIAATMFALLLKLIGEDKIKGFYSIGYVTLALFPTAVYGGLLVYRMIDLIG